GFTWTSRDMDETQAKAIHGWEVAKQKITSGEYDIFLMDEFTYVMTFGWLKAGEVVAWLRENKPAALHLIITGRNAPPELIEFADSFDVLLSTVTPECRLEIMKDPRAGSWAVTGLALLLLGKWIALRTLSPPLLIVPPVMGRWAMVLAAAAFPLARDSGSAFH